MATTPRLLWQNFVQLGGATLTASSAAVGQPVRRLRDPLPSNRWRSATGWTIVLGWNDRIDFNRGGAKVATIAPGTYATGALLAVAIVAALEAADATPVWACSYSGTTFKFTISSDLAFTLLYATGANLARSAGRDLGYSVADTSSATSHVSDSQAFQSRHYVLIDLGSIQDVQAAIAYDHNSGTGGTYSFLAASGAADLPGDPDATVALSNTSRKDILRIASLTTAISYRYWALIIEDVQNADGFVEVGVPYLGGWLELEHARGGIGRDFVDFTQVAFADQGANYQDRKQRTRVWAYTFTAISESLANELDTAATHLLSGGDFFFIRDPTAPAEALYVFFPDLPAITHNADSDNDWDVAFKIQEVLG